MIAIRFPEANCYFGPPPDMEESQVHTIHAHRGVVPQGPVEGSPFVVTCWQMSPEELEDIRCNGGKVYLMFLGGLPPHLAATSFKAATTLS